MGLAGRANAAGHLRTCDADEPQAEPTMRLQALEMSVHVMPFPWLIMMQG